MMKDSPLTFRFEMSTKAALEPAAGVDGRRESRVDEHTLRAQLTKHEHTQPRSAPKAAARKKPVAAKVSLVNEAGADSGAPTRGGRPVRRRRLSDMILAAAHSACDQGDLEAAERLLAVVESMLRRGPAEGPRERRLDVQPLVAAFERIWVLRHPEASDD